MIKQFAVIFFVFVIGTVNAQDINVAKLDSLFNAIELSNKFMGNIAVSKNGQIVYSKSIGYSDIANNKKATANTKYRIGSITKTYTAVMVMQAVDEKKLSLDQTLDKYFPQVVNANKITIRNLLSHKSGIPNFTKADNYKTYSIEGKTKKEMLEIISTSGSNFEPNTKSEYSNSNYLLLSYILEKIYKKSYPQILHKKIVKPLGLSQTYFGGPIVVNKNEACSYALDSVWVKQPETNMDMLTGAGAIVATPTDVLQFVEAVFGGKVISQQSLDEMEKDYLGVGDFSFEDHGSYGHTGHVDGFYSLYGYFPNDKISFIISSNGTDIDNNDVAVGLLSIIFNFPYDIPSFK